MPEIYSCPWCPTRVVTFESPLEARRFMETHLDTHMAHPIGRPRPEAAA